MTPGSLNPRKSRRAWCWTSTRATRWSASKCSTFHVVRLSSIFRSCNTRPPDAVTSPDKNTTRIRGQGNNISHQRLKSGLQLVLGDVRADDLVLDLAILEKQQVRHGADAIADGQCRVGDVIYLYHLRPASHILRELIEDRHEILARAA